MGSWRRTLDHQHLYSYMLLALNCFVGLSVMQGGIITWHRNCSQPLAVYLIVSGLFWFVTAIQDFYARKNGWQHSVEFPTPSDVFAAKCVAGAGLCWLLLGNFWVLFTTTCARSLFWTARYYCILINVAGITCIIMLCFDSVAAYAESIVGLNYAIVWRKKFARDPGYSDIDVVDAEYATVGR